MTSQNIKITVYSVVGVLVLVLIGVVGYLYLSGRQPVGLQQVARLNVGGVSSTEANRPFNVSVLSSGAYKNLDRSLLDANKLPVRVPENRGKANLFGI